jgi:glutathione synthase/RimK-type ligase-like ATP-grasp enzyme
MRRVAFLTLHDPAGFVIDDDLAHAPLAKRGVAVDNVPWDRPDVDWTAYDLVVLRSTWDYQHHAEKFFETLAAIERGGTPLWNGTDIVRWNMPKTYLRELEEHGVPVVPTLWRERLGPGELLPLFDAAGNSEVVIKPVVSGNAQGAYRLDRETAAAHAEEIEAYFANRPLMMQPFERNIVEEGEFSMIYFNGQLSHSILKVPKSGDFRVQEEHGGDIRAIRAEPSLTAAGNAAMRAVGSVLLYGRVDLVRNGAEFRVMELELIEPALYLRMDPGAPDRFADAITSLIA